MGMRGSDVVPGCASASRAEAALLREPRSWTFVAGRDAPTPPQTTVYSPCYDLVMRIDRGTERSCVSAPDLAYEFVLLQVPARGNGCGIRSRARQRDVTCPSP